MSEHNAQADVKPEHSIILGTEPIASSTSSTTSTSDTLMPLTSTELFTASTTPPTMAQDLILCEDEKVISSVGPAISQEYTMEGKLKSLNRLIIILKRKTFSKNKNNINLFFQGQAYHHLQRYQIITNP